jgi:phasin family protein
MNSTFPFAEMDVTKFMANFKVPGFEYEALVEAQRKNVAAWQEVGERASKSFQTIAQRQVEMAQKGFEDAIAGAQDVATAATPEDGAKRQVAFAQQALEAQIANAREIGELAQKVGGEVYELVNKRVVEGLDEWQAVSEAANGSAPKAAPKSKAK